MELIVKARSSETRLFEIGPTATLKWSISVANNDVELSAVFVPSDSSANQTAILPATRNAQFSGSFTAPSSGQIRLTFDNSFSWTKSKTLTYQIEQLNAYHPSFELQMGRTLRCMYGSATIEGRRQTEDGTVLYICQLPHARAVLHPTSFFCVQRALRESGSRQFDLLCPFLAAKDLQLPLDDASQGDNSRVMVGIHMFFNNRVDEAEQFFAPEADKSVIFALAYGAIAFLRANLTWEPHELEEAKRRLEHAQSMAERSIEQLGSGGSWFSSKTIASNELHTHLDSTIVAAECNLVGLTVYHVLSLT